jgi:hypothetical protein
MEGPSWSGFSALQVAAPRRGALKAVSPIARPMTPWELRAASADSPPVTWIGGIRGKGLAKGAQRSPMGDVGSRAARLMINPFNDYVKFKLWGNLLI